MVVWLCCAVNLAIQNNNKTPARSAVFFIVIPLFPIVGSNECITRKEAGAAR